VIETLPLIIAVVSFAVGIVYRLWQTKRQKRFDLPLKILLITFIGGCGIVCTLWVLLWFFSTLNFKIGAQVSSFLLLPMIAIALTAFIALVGYLLGSALTTLSHRIVNNAKKP
jgi:hypothetical protein